MELIVRTQLGSHLDAAAQAPHRVRPGRPGDGHPGERGVVGPSEGSKAREVLMTVEELEDATGCRARTPERSRAGAGVSRDRMIWTVTAPNCDRPRLASETPCFRSSRHLELSAGTAPLDLVMTRRLYRAMVVARTYDRKGTALQKQGRLATYAPFEGQEAAQIGSAAALASRRLDGGHLPRCRRHVDPRLPVGDCCSCGPHRRRARRLSARGGQRPAAVDHGRRAHGPRRRPGVGGEAAGRRIGWR